METFCSGWEEDCLRYLFLSFSHSISISFSRLAFFSTFFSTFFSSFFSSCFLFLFFSFLAAQKRGKVFPTAGGEGGASSRTE